MSERRLHTVPQMNLASFAVLLFVILATSWKVRTNYHAFDFFLIFPHHSPHSQVESYRSANVKPAIFNRACLTRCLNAVCFYIWFSTTQYHFSGLQKFFACKGSTAVSVQKVSFFSCLNYFEFLQFLFFSCPRGNLSIFM